MGWGGNMGTGKHTIAMGVEGAGRAGSRVLAALAFAGLAGLTVAAAADRSGMPVVQDGWLAANGSQAGVRAAIETHSAQGMARRLVTAVPLRQVNLSLAILAQAVHNDGVVSPPVVVAAGHLGWRDPLLQAAACKAALQAGRTDEAVDRVEALFRAHPQSRFSPMILLSIAQDERAVRQINQRLARNPWWAASVPMIIARADRISLGVMLPMMKSAAASGFTPDGLPAIEHLLDRDPAGALAMQIALGGGGDFAESGLWRANPSAAAKPRSQGSPFAWRKAQGANAWLSDGADGTLTIELADNAPVHVAGIFAPVNAGSYRLSWRVGSAGAVSLDARCVLGNVAANNGPLFQEGHWRWRDIEVPTGCTFLHVRMLTHASRGRLEVSETTLRPLT
ncbi:hypothetical protein [Croceicoccus gelatinilyticus]|uniref:hypothetical protein n=1 Tax=Croceicoccus gelatinilyticus TaxID=2835536 RepID=UPI001BD15D18|nr:hypothetical protein [Croceicoccus gelatinilyticus]MBS7668929.1 hypothetical protein [Croceicoccus gelatinilyticus]